MRRRRCVQAFLLRGLGQCRNRHKEGVAAEIDVMIDGQREMEITTEEPSAPRSDRLAGNGFRVRPWFEPGAGRTVDPQHIEALPHDVPNHAHMVVRADRARKRPDLPQQRGCSKSCTIR